MFAALAYGAPGLAAPAKAAKPSAPPNARPSAPRYFFHVGTVSDAEGIKSGVLDEARALLLDELRKHPEVTVDLGVPEADIPAQLTARKLAGYELSLKILEVERSSEPPPTGKQYAVLKRRVRLSLFGTTIPGKVMAVGGEGDAQVAMEVSINATPAALDKSAHELLVEICKDALRQAVDLTIAKMELAQKARKNVRRLK